MKTAAFLCCLMAAIAPAQDIPWFEAHPTERLTVLRRCQSDHRIGRSPICANAETAETKAYARRLKAGSLAPVGIPRPVDHTAMAAMCQQSYSRITARMCQRY